ncbi:MAG: RHS repeat-associated core domain-containing protein, partial [Proteobacteria bacterium]|nr:RHS repeat-associated core domain-containing protein [Pseudomonadota bacterium]
YYPLGQEATLPTKDAFQLKFTGHERDANGLSGDLDYMHARYCNPQLGRFLSLDPVMQTGRAMGSPQLWNRYSYALNNPLNYTDPTGEDVSIQLTFVEDPGSEIWTEEMKQLVIDYVRQFWLDLDVGVVHVFDSAKSKETNFSWFRNGVAKIKVDASFVGRSNTEKVAAGLFLANDRYSLDGQLWGISNAINHEFFTHIFRINTDYDNADLARFDRRREHPWVGPELRYRYGTVVDPFTHLDPRFRDAFYSGPVPVHSVDRKLASDKLKSIDLSKPSSGSKPWWKFW